MELLALSLVKAKYSLRLTRDRQSNEYTIPWIDLLCRPERASRVHVVSHP